MVEEGPKVFASLPSALMLYAQSLGLPRDLLLETARLDDEQLVDPDELVDYTSLRRLWNLLLERFPDQPLGLNYAKLIRPSALGILGYACTNARDFRQSLSFYRRFACLVDPHLSLDVEDLGDTNRSPASIARRSSTPSPRPFDRSASSRASTDPTNTCRLAADTVGASGPRLPSSS